MTSDEVSPQERFAKVSKQFSSNPKHAQRLYNYASKHWLSYSTPILSHGRNKKGLAVSCFESNTLVETSEGMLPIKDIEPGMLVRSHDNTFNAVEAVQSQYSTDMYEVTIGSETFLVTGNHLFHTEECGWVAAEQLDSNLHTLTQSRDHLDIQT
jgi:hypothetical protein